MMQSISSSKKTACAQRSYEITRADLPLACPMPHMELWNAHPRVYLPVAKTGRAICPYCNAEYVLKNDE